MLRLCVLNVNKHIETLGYDLVCSRKFSPWRLRTSIENCSKKLELGGAQPDRDDGSAFWSFIKLLAGRKFVS